MSLGGGFRAESMTGCASSWDRHSVALQCVRGACDGRPISQGLRAQAPSPL